MGRKDNKSSKRGKVKTIALISIGLIMSALIIKNMNFIVDDLVEAVNGTNTKLEQERLEQERLEQEKLDQDRLEQERLEQERLEQEKLEQEKLEQERLEQERLEQEKKDQEKKNQGNGQQDKNSNNNSNNRKIAYLTFDDGPSRKSTPAVLNILKEYNVKATFFVVGKMINENTDILKRIHEEGHQIGNHSYGHDYKYLYSDAKNFMADIYKTEELIRSIIGQDFNSKIIRFPGGSFEKRKDPMKKAAKEAGYNYIDWNSLNGDAEGPKRTKAQLLSRLKETSVNKNEIVVLMHDTDAKDTTVEFLRDGIDYLISQGFEFRVLDKNYK